MKTRTTVWEGGGLVMTAIEGRSEMADLLALAQPELEEKAGLDARALNLLLDDFEAHPERYGAYASYLGDKPVGIAVLRKSADAANHAVLELVWCESGYGSSAAIVAALRDEMERWMRDNGIATMTAVVARHSSPAMAVRMEQLGFTLRAHLYGRRQEAE